MNENTQKFVEGVTANGLSILDTLLDGSRQSKTVPFPGWRGKPKDEGGQDLSVTLWLLGFDELAAAEVDTLKYLRETLKMSENDIDRLEGVRDLEIKCQTLLRAMRHPEQPTVPFARLITTVRRLEPDTIQALYDTWIEFTAARSPFQSVGSMAELEEVVEFLGKGFADETYLARFDSTSLRRITRSLGNQVAKLLSQSSSASSSESASAPSST